MSDKTTRIIVNVWQYKYIVFDSVGEILTKFTLAFDSVSSNFLLLAVHNFKDYHKQ